MQKLTTKGNTMVRTIVLAGLQGPAFGDRASATNLLSARYIINVRNFPSTERNGALRAAFDQLSDNDLPIGNS